MIRVEDHGELTFFRMARRLAGVPLYWTGAYLLDGLLVDCGPPATAAELMQALSGRAVEGLVITHHHEDHMGGAARLQRDRGIRARIHAAGVPLVEAGFRQELYRRAAWGKPPLVPAEALGDEVVTGRLRFEVISTPGHSPDHVCFFEKDRGWLFTGDLFLAERLRFLRADEDLVALIASLDTVCRLSPSRVFCAHRGPLADGPAALCRKRDALVSMRERIRELLGQGLPEADVARRAVGPEGPLTWFSGGHFSARNFVREVVKARP